MSLEGGEECFVYGGMLWVLVVWDVFEEYTLGVEFSHNSCHMGDIEAIWDTKIFFV